MTEEQIAVLNTIVSIMREIQKQAEDACLVIAEDIQAVCDGAVIPENEASAA